MKIKNPGEVLIPCVIHSWSLYSGDMIGSQPRCVLWNPHPPVNLICLVQPLITILYFMVPLRKTSSQKLKMLQWDFCSILQLFSTSQKYCTKNYKKDYENNNDEVVWFIELTFCSDFNMRPKNISAITYTHTPHKSPPRLLCVLLCIVRIKLF